MRACAAPWYELNLSAPDDNASACCYYGGEKEAFSGGDVELSHYWNGPGMRALRRLQADPNPPSPNGCSGCFFYLNRPDSLGSNYFDFDQARPADISPAQSQNWDLARREHAEGREWADCVPMRLYANFGYTCNLACKMCHQVPRRQHIDRFITSESMYAWHDSLRKMLEVCVIGGEPFAMPEAVKFIRRFAVDETMDDVRLSVFTNGTVHHKHFDTLKRKRKLGVCISLDSISQGYEKIRIGGQWPLVERNLMMIKEVMSKERPEWWLATNGIIMKTGVPYLPEFARWHVRHGIHTQFLDFINFRGTEDAYYTENLLDQPHLLDDVEGWEDDFDEAIEIFQTGGQSAAAASLKHFYDRVLAARQDTEEAKLAARRRSSRNDLSSIMKIEPDALGSALMFHSPEATRDPAYDATKSPPVFTQTRPGDHACSDWRQISAHAGSVYRLLVEWPKTTDTTRHAHVVCQSPNGELGGFREFTEQESGTSMRMSGPVPPETRMLRVLVLPVGEDTSVFPSRISLDVDQDSLFVEAASPPPRQSRVPRGALATVSKSMRSFGRGVTTLLRRD